MILLLDIGNSRVKWAWLDDGQWQPGGVVEHRARQFDELWQQCWGNVAAPIRVVAAVVAPAVLTESLGRWVRQQWGLDIEQVRSTTTAASVINGYREPEQLGVDRWCALLGARAIEHGACLVIDCGTAVTVDLLQASGEHVGGWIAPGLAMMRGQLLQGTNGVRFSADELDASQGREFGRNTAMGVAAGTGQMLAGLIVQALAEAERHYGQRPRCLLTGGDAEVVLPLLPADVRHEPELVLKGVAVLARNDR